MAIFSRRVIQRMLNENRSFLPGQTVNRQVNWLNNQNKDSLAAEWEVLLLNALSKIGKVEYEKRFSGSKKPDIFFKSSKTLYFVADITAVSDASYEQDNPTEYFFRCIREYFQKNGMLASGLKIKIKSDNVGTYRNKKVRLYLPHRSKIQNFPRVL